MCFRDLQRVSAIFIIANLNTSGDVIWEAVGAAADELAPLELCHDRLVNISRGRESLLRLTAAGEDINGQ